MEYTPSPDETVILTSSTNRRVEYPGLTLHFVRGPRTRSDDLPFAGFHASSTARAFLENLSSSKASAGKCLNTVELEDRLENLLQVKGEQSLSELRDNAKRVSEELSWPHEYEKLNQMISALFSTQPSDSLLSPRSQARARQKPFDLERLNRLDLLFSHLKSTPLKELREKHPGNDHFRNKAFFEAYFSNYIEGTTFEINEAEEIIFDHIFPADRPQDAHDILGTFNIVSDPNELKRTPKNYSELSTLLKERHHTLMQNRREALPGKFKEKPNRAGGTHFVHPDNIEGTLEQGLLRYQDLQPGMARAIFVMFLISEIHPFSDGNGRISRIMMNAELYATSHSTIIIPNVYREDYLSALRALTRGDRREELVQRSF